MKKLLLAVPLIAFALCHQSCKKEYITQVRKDTTIVVIQDTVSWTYANLNTGWSAGANGNSVKYQIIGNIVYLSGLCTANLDASQTLFTLNASCSPKYQAYLQATEDNGSQVLVEIFPSGQVYIPKPPIGQTLFFDNIQFAIN